MSPVPSHAVDCRRGVPRGARFLDSRIGDSGFSQSKKPTRRTSAPRHADLRRGCLRRNGMAASCGRPRASATQACVDFPATVPQAAWRGALDDQSACMPPWRLEGAPSPRRPHQPPLRRARQAPTGHADVPLVVTFVEVPEASGPPVAPPACVRGSTAGETFSPPMQGGPPPDGQGRRAPKKRKSRPDACRRGRLSDRLEVIE